MKNRGNQRPPKPAPPPPKPRVQAEEYTFGDPVEVMDRREMLDYVECLSNGRYFDPPVSLDGLARAFNSAVHHSSPIYVKRNILVSSFVPHPLLARQAFARWALDYLVFGNGYLECVRNRLGGVMALKPSPAKYMRRGVDLDRYWWVPNFRDEHQFTAGTIHHLLEPDINQEVYGVPEYLSGLNAAFLNESSTLFRRRYYKNGSHAGVIFYLTDPMQDETYVDDFRVAIKSSKGPGNFRNLFLYAPNGKKDGLQVIPVSETTAKDEFFNVKAVTRDDLLAAHRVPPQLMGILPNNTGGFGDAAKAAQVFAINEIQPIQTRMREVNDWLGEEVIRFEPYQLANQPAV
ncbi:phage portal protein [Chitiniphilus eburneus]|uniref:phage portal protein n=1 Tax=Chitiniphilus eburneus TaxID=2571148 RepID=UPI0035D0DD95